MEHLLFLLLLIMPSVSHPDLHPLLSFKSSSDPSNLSLPTWLPSSHPCSFHGIACRGGRVVHVLLPSLSLSGPVNALTQLSHVRLLNLSHNRLSGPLPAAVVLLVRLRRLDLSHNQLTGSIPAELGRLPRLVTLRLESNRLVGEVPISLSSFPSSAFTGNLGLCGKPLIGTRCVGPHTKNAGSASHLGRLMERSKLVTITIAGSISAALLLVALVVLLLWLCKMRARKRTGRRVETINVEVEGSRGGGREERKVVFFEGCKRFKVEELMRGSADVLGRGEAATTYRVVREGEVGNGVVVKRMRRGTGALAAVEGLLKVLGGLRHPNVVSLRAYCYSSEELLLVYDYFPDGSLHARLHENRGPGRIRLDWSTRLDLAVDAAEGLAYLHAACRRSYLSHHHLTSTNILLDNDGRNALVSDFALHALLSHSAQPSSHKADVYRFGVVLLELLTGRASGDVGEDLTKWIERVVREEWTSKVFDVEVAAEKEMEDEMVALLQVAMLCTGRAEAERPKMSVVARMVAGIRERRGRRKIKADEVRSSGGEDVESNETSTTGGSTGSLLEETQTVTSG